MSQCPFLIQKLEETFLSMISELHVPYNSIQCISGTDVCIAFCVNSFLFKFEVMYFRNRYEIYFASIFSALFVFGDDTKKLTSYLKPA